jgi:hypothetical protein
MKNAELKKSNKMSTLRYLACSHNKLSSSIANPHISYKAFLFCSTFDLFGDLFFSSRVAMGLFRA